ncbi:hypothetical protein SAMN05444287_1802 [Octadecabacter temperatus]|uniref:Uncharacterized protein n=1 Tax=Octadecabacter temperatus TaxID=1458307 RepID=A0A0K0Y6U1_9RHOB|nr:DUF3299 domain-containing protein [Octadecabacter temperatus]AKS46684.1 hypothetical protein OSB_21450 [Octadecabacter temperatus]SIO19257.1 hypothetical protein SAMN05444287_1802 [Octadecabacter temperatus]
MVTLPPNRRSLLVGLAALACAPRGALADDVIDLKWRDLVPETEIPIPPSVQGLFEHDETDTLTSEQPRSSGVRTDWNGQVVSLPGFIVPIDFSGSGVTAFILVPYVGACVHVPPPPANQLVFVTTSKPYESSGMFEAVTVVGMFGTASTSTQLADISYALSADSIEPFPT